MSFKPGVVGPIPSSFAASKRHQLYTKAGGPCTADAGDAVERGERRPAVAVGDGIHQRHSNCVLDLCRSASRADEPWWMGIEPPKPALRKLSAKENIVLSDFPHRQL